jgi:hypothetical protein
MGKRETREQAIARAEREAREANAMREWFVLAERPDYAHGRGRAFVCEVEALAISVQIRGMHRAPGGVAVVCRGDFRDYPRYLDDLIAEWQGDTNAYIRCAAARMLALRENVLALGDDAFDLPSARAA